MAVIPERAMTFIDLMNLFVPNDGQCALRW